MMCIEESMFYEVLPLDIFRENMHNKDITDLPGRNKL